MIKKAIIGGMDPRADKFVDIGENIVCFCGMTLGRRKDRNTITVVKFHEGKPVYMVTEYGGLYKISCPKCGFGAMFQHFEESINTQDSIAPKTDEV